MRAKITIEFDKPVARINPSIYGHFAEHIGTCVYEGLWVGPESPIPNRNGLRVDVIDALKKIHPPVLRWPGGCFADDYHWQDGIGPREARPRRLNAHWDAEESNEFGTHEFFELCSQLKCEPYICGNLGSGTVKEMRDWLEYMNSERDTSLTRLRAENGSPDPFGVLYFGIGNENWGCGGNLTPSFYAQEVRRYATFASLAGGNFLFKIACGANSDDYDWTREFFNVMAGSAIHYNRLNLVNGFALHYYCGTAGTATEYTKDQWYQLFAQALRMEQIVLTHRQVMDHFDPHRQMWLVVDEWGTWHPPMTGTNPRWVKQQNTIRDALVAALTLDIFNRHADIVFMANIAQIANVLQSMVLTDGPQMLLTPTYHVYEMYSPHQGAQALKMQVETKAVPYAPTLGTTALPPVPHVAGSCSRKGATITLSLVNTHATDATEVELIWHGEGNLTPTTWRVLATPDIHSCNTFEQPENAIPQDQDVGSIGDVFTLAPASVNVIQYALQN